MHSTKGASGDVTFFHHGDFSGDVHIVAPAGRVRQVGDGMAELRIGFQDLQVVVAEHIRRLRIAELESSTPSQLLGIAQR